MPTRHQSRKSRLLPKVLSDATLVTSSSPVLLLFTLVRRSTQNTDADLATLHHVGTTVPWNRRGKKPGEMKQKNPAKYKLACVKFRISVESDPPELKVASSCSDKTKRRDLAAEFFDSIEAESYIGAEERVQFCNEGQFVGYYMMFEAMKEAAAKALWQKSSHANSGFARRTNKQGQLTIAVELPSMATRGKKNSHTRRLETKDVKGESEDEDEFQESSRKKFKLDVEDGQIDGLGIENPFRIGASVVVELVQSPMKLAPLTQDAFGSSGSGVVF